MNRQSDVDQRIVDRLNAELSLIAIPARVASRTAPKSGLRSAAFLTAALAVLVLMIGGFRTLREIPAPNDSPATQSQRTGPIARCSDGRPQAEIDFAGRMLWEPTANEISCVFNATVSGPGASRVYRLADGRFLGMYERVESLPVKPTVAPNATGSADVNGATWSWSILPGRGQTLLLQGSLAGAPVIDLSIELTDQAADLRLLRTIATSLHQVVVPSPKATLPASVGTPTLAAATEGSRRGPVSTAEIVARLNAAGVGSRISSPAPSRLLLFNATDEDLVTVDESAIKGFVVYRYPSVAAAASAFRLDAVQDPGRGTVSYVAKPYFVGIGDALVVFATNDEALARRVIAALVP